MNTKFFAALIGIAILATGCVRTVDNKHTAAVPFVKDKFESRYERPADQVYDAAKQVLQDNGVLLYETALVGGPNPPRVVEGKVNQRKVWIRVEPVDARVTAVTVQARNRAGGRDLNLIHELDKQIALKLTR